MPKNKDNSPMNFRNLFDTPDKEKTTKSQKKYKKNKAKHMPTQSRPISIYRKIAISFIVLTLLLAAVVIYFSIVSVKIIIIPNKERTSASFIATVKDVDSQEEVQGMVIEGSVSRVPVEAEAAFTATGKDVKDIDITGTVTIYNNTNVPQPLIKTTRLLSPDEKLFRIKETIKVPANGQIENVAIYADQSGSEMAIEPTTFTIPGLREAKQEFIYAESFEQFQYQELGETLVSAEDIEEAQNNLKQQLSDKLETMVESKEYKGYDNVIYKVDDEAVAFSSDVRAGDKVGEFSMSATAEAAVVAFSTNKVAELAKLKVQEALPDDKQLESFDKNNFQYSVDRYDLDKGLADLRVEVAAQMVLKEGTEIIKAERLVGLSREQLDDYLSSLREVAGYEIKFTPNWINKVPSLVDHVKVEIAK